jgi:hypothetical protein
MRTLVQAIITGFGLKLGADIYRYVKQRVGLPDPPEADDVVATGGGEKVIDS